MKTGIIFGFLGLLGSIINFYSTIFVGDIPFVSGHIIDIVLVCLSIIGSIYFFKNYLNSGYLHLWQGIILGFWTLVVLINFISLFQYFYLQVIDPTLLLKYKQFMQQDFESKKLELQKEGLFEDAKAQLNAFRQADNSDVVLHQIALKFLPFPITVFVVFFSSLYLRKVAK